MDLARGPDPSLPDARDRSTPQTADGPHVEARDAALARLPDDQRRSLIGLTRAVEAQFDAIRAGGSVPAGFDGVVRAYDATHRIGGVPVSPDYADVRATIEAQRPTAESLGVHTPAVTPAQTVPASDVEARRDSTGATRELDPEVARSLAVFRDVLARDPDVTKADLDRLTDIVVASTPERMRAVNGELSEAEHTRWAAELAADYSPAARSELYGELVERFDEPSLLTFAYYHEHPGSDGTDGRLLGQAVAQHAPAATTEAFVRNAAVYTVPPESRGAHRELAPNLEGRAEIGVAGAAALAALDRPALNRTLGALSEAGTLGGLVSRSVTTHDVTVHLPGEDGGRVDVPTVNADSLVRMLGSARFSEGDLASSSRATASFVDAAARELTRLEGLPNGTDLNGSVEQVRDGITRVLQANPVGVLENYSERVAPDGRGELTEYFGSMLRSGQTDTLRGLVADLSTGNGTAASSADWVLREFPDPNGGSTPSLRNAETLGFTVGSIGRAIENTSESARERGETVKQVFGTVADGIAVGAPDAGSVLSLADRFVSLFVDRRTERQVEANDALLDDLTLQSTPTFASADPDRSGPPVQGAALKAYTDAVRDALRPVATPGQDDARPLQSPTRP